MTDTSLSHYGVKGMRWGVRREDGSSRITKAQVKKAAVIVGSAAAVAAIAAGSYYASTHLKTAPPKLDLSDISRQAKEFSESFAREPVGIVHGARGKNKGWTFPQRGGLDDPVKEYGQAFGNSEGGTAFKRYGARNEKVAARFEDPEGRKDFAGRPIVHEVMIPENLARGVKNLEDAKNAAWPLIKDTYNALYEDEAR